MPSPSTQDPPTHCRTPSWGLRIAGCGKTHIWCQSVQCGQWTESGERQRVFLATCANSCANAQALCPARVECRLCVTCPGPRRGHPLVDLTPAWDRHRGGHHVTRPLDPAESLLHWAQLFLIFGSRQLFSQSLPQFPGPWDSELHRACPELALRGSLVARCSTVHRCCSVPPWAAVFFAGSSGASLRPGRTPSACWGGAASLPLPRGHPAWQVLVFLCSGSPWGVLLGEYWGFFALEAPGGVLLGKYWVSLLWKPPGSPAW